MQKLTYKVTHKSDGHVEVIDVSFNGGIEAVMDALDGRNSEPSQRFIDYGYDTAEMISSDGHIVKIEAVN